MQAGARSQRVAADRAFASRSRGDVNSDTDDGLRLQQVALGRRLGGTVGVQYDCRRQAGREALSGLARSFFYAGARRFWSRIGRSIRGRTGLRYRPSTAEGRPKIGRAEALRQAMLAYLNDASSPRNAYPAFWAPFALIGEGPRADISDAACSNRRQALATDGRAITTANAGKAPQQLFERDQGHFAE